MKVAPSCAIMISSYEFGKAYFRKRKEKDNVEKAILPFQFHKEVHAKVVRDMQ